MSEITSSKFDVSKYITISLVLSIASQFSMFVYYYRFSFSPIDYYEPSEIIINTAKDFAIIAVFIIFILHTITSNMPSETKIIKIATFGNDIRGVKGYWLRNYVSITSFILSVLLIGLLEYFNQFFLPLYIGLFLLGLFELYKLNERNFEKLHLSNPKYHAHVQSFRPYLNFDYMIGGTIILLYASLIADAKARHCATQNKYIGTEFTLTSGEKIIITPKNLLIGHSKNYVILYNASSNTVRPIKRVDLTKETLKVKNQGLLTSILLTY